MSAAECLLFIDANKYLDLYRTVNGKKLLTPLGEQADHIFVTQQVVEEVQRNKISVAAAFLAKHFGELKLQTFNIPDHLCGTSSGQGNSILRQMGEIVQRIRKVNEEVEALATSIMEQISRCQDEVSKALAPIFARAVPHTADELQRARDRRERGNPPGKNDNRIGDQLTWEQILTHFRGKKKLYIISRDGDYGTVFEGKGFLNQFLYGELCRVSDSPEVFLFEDTIDGIKHFLDVTGMRCDKLTPEEIKEIREEEKALPPLDLSGSIRRSQAALAAAARPPRPVVVVQQELAPEFFDHRQPLITRPLPPATKQANEPR
jgi:hypothetical protein